MRKRRPSKHRRMRRMTVAGGEKELHSGKRRDKEEDVEGKRRWRHEEALQCQHHNSDHTALYWGPCSTSVRSEGRIKPFVIWDLRFTCAT